MKLRNDDGPILQNLRGFSRIKVFIVLAVLALGVAAGGMYYQSGYSSVDFNDNPNSVGILSSGLETYKTLGGYYPSQSQGLEALLVKPTTSPRPRRWNQILDSEKPLYDVWGTKYKYFYPGKQDSTRPEIVSAGPDKTFGTDDDQSSQDE